MGAAGPYITYNFVESAKSHPDWKGPLTVAGNYVHPVFWTAAAGLLTLAVLRRWAGLSYSALLKRANRAQELEDMIGENIYALVDGMLLGFAKKLNLQVNDQSRLTLYVKSENSRLTTMGRYATNPMDSGGDPHQVNANEGCVGVAWRDGWCYQADLGEWNAYARNCVAQGVGRVMTAAPKMKSRFVSALRVDDGNAMPFAVLVLESCQPRRFEESFIKAEMCNYIAFFEHSIPKLLPHMPAPSIAASRGM